MSDDCVFKKANSAPDNKTVIDNASDATIVLFSSTDNPDVIPLPTPSVTPTTTSTQTLTPTTTPTPSHTQPVTPTQTSSPTQTPTTTASKTPTPTATPTNTKSAAIVVPSPSASATSTPQSTSTPTGTPTQTGTPTRTPPLTPTTTSTTTATPTPTNTITATVTPSSTPPVTPTPSPDNSPTPIPSSSVPATPTKTPHPTATPATSPLPPENPVPCETSIIEVLADGSEVILDPNSVTGAGEICCTTDCGGGGAGGGGGGAGGGGGGAGGGGGGFGGGGGGFGGGGGGAGGGGGGFGGPLIPGGGGGGNGPAGGGDPNGNCAANFIRQITIPNNITDCDQYWASFNNLLKQQAIDAWNAAPYYRNAIGKKIPLEDHPTQTNKDCWDPNPVKKFTRTEGAICGGKCYYKYWYEPRPTIKQTIGCITPTPTPTPTSVCFPQPIQFSLSNCQRIDTILTVTNNFNVPAQFYAEGVCNDEIIFDGQIYEEREHIFPWYGDVCGLGLPLNGSHHFVYSKILQPGESITIGGRDNGLGGGTSGYYTLCPQ